MISRNHPVCVVSEVIDKIDIEILIKKYKGGLHQLSSPHAVKPQFSSYLSIIYSGRKMEAAVKEYIYFMWLSGMATHDHLTLNKIRSEFLRHILKEVLPDRA